MNSEMVELFKYWITERDSMRSLRESHAIPPWSRDPIMANNHFCNVRREDDRGTKQIRAVVKSHDWLSVESLPWVYTAARLFNKYDTLDFVLSQIKKGDSWSDILKERMENGGKVFHTAYVVSTNGRSMSKIDFVMEVIFAVEDIEVRRGTCAAAYDDLMSVNGIGSFLAGQVIADLKNDRYLAGALDWDNWSSMGPGSKKGLDYIFGGGTTHRNYSERIYKLRAACAPVVRASLHNQDLQNCLCEFSKYVAIKQGTRGRSRPYHACK